MEAQFERAVYLKPALQNAAVTDAERFAPLLLIESTATAGSPDPPDANLPKMIFFSAGRLQLNGKWHEQKTYWWNYPHRRKGSLPVQGVRITLNSAGSPAIWEVLADTSGAAVIFVAQSLEAQAVREFGLPLAGRRFAIEKSVSEAPDTVVARVIEDGPVVMGPVVYLRADTHEVTTVICRCMDAQARDLAAQMEYDLANDGVPRSVSRSAGGIETRLRLPKNF